MKRRISILLSMVLAVILVMGMGMSTYAMHYTDTVDQTVLNVGDTFAPGTSVIGVTPNHRVIIRNSSEDSKCIMESNFVFASSYNGDNGDFSLEDGQVWGVYGKTWPATEDIVIHVKPVAAPHIHSFESSWTTNAEYHWHACTATGATDSCKTAGGAAYGAHTWNASTGCCSTCAYACNHNGLTTGVCPTCGYSLGYTITVSSAGNGSASASKTNAHQGDTITLRAVPDSGYELDRWESSDVTIRNNSFEMPAKAVSIVAYFKLSSAPDPTPSPSPTPSPEPEIEDVVEEVKSEHEQESNDGTEQEAIKNTFDIVQNDKTDIDGAAESLVPSQTYNLSSYVTSAGMVRGLESIIVKNNTQIGNANTNHLNTSRQVSFYTGKPMTFNKAIAEVICSSKADVVYYFKYKGHLYKVTIPRGTNPTLILEECNYAGPLYVGKVLGTAVLIK
ncbi:MAG: hypothetical protein KBT19_04700 [Lachnospiraceae bacterium]|nr:hypothetical protein [Candidatus Colinaster equi]